MTSARFDNRYYINILQGRGLLATDNILVSQDQDGEIEKLVWAYASDQQLFFREFAASMLKMGSITPLTGEQGEIRRNCRLLNSWLEDWTKLCIYFDSLPLVTLSFVSLLLLFFFYLHEVVLELPRGWYVLIYKNQGSLFYERSHTWERASKNAYP